MTSTGKFIYIYIYIYIYIHIKGSYLVENNTVHEDSSNFANFFNFENIAASFEQEMQRINKSKG